jgi:hypothetical protein
MLTMDPFSGDNFSLTELTAAINAQAYKPQQLAALGIFEESGIATTSAIIESDGDSISLVPIVPRNAPGQVVNADKRDARSFLVPHIPQRATIMADEVQGVREFGMLSAQTVNSVRDRRLAKMRNQIDYTIEAHRLAAVKGDYYNANGVATSLFTEFGVTQQEQGMDLNVSTTNVRGKLEDVLEMVENALGGIAFTAPTVICGKTFFQTLIDHPKVKEAVINWNAAVALRNDPRLPLEFGGMQFARYRGTSDVALDVNQAFVIPMGVQGLFLTHFAPANYIETVNTLGLPYYSKAEELDLQKGIMIEAQSNPLNICARPRAIVKLTTTTIV